MILCVANLARSAQPLELDLSTFKGRVPVELLGRTAFPPIGDLPYMLTLAGYGFYWFRLTTDVEVPNWHEESHLAAEDRAGVRAVRRLEHAVPRPCRALAHRHGGQGAGAVRERHLAALHRRAALVRHQGLGVERARLADHALWTLGPQRWLLSVLALDTAGGSQEAASYFLPLALAWEDTDEERMRSLAVAAVAG